MDVNLCQVADTRLMIHVIIIIVPVATVTKNEEHLTNILYDSETLDSTLKCDT